VIVTHHEIDGVWMSAGLSEDGLHRYFLTRAWSLETIKLVLIMLNPSTADAFRDDPTIKRCMGFARAWGYTVLEVVNLFAFRATKPAKLKKAKDPVGPENDQVIRTACFDAKRVVAAWGTHGSYLGRDEYVMREVLAGYDIYWIRKTKKCKPEHPLYLPGKLKPTLFRKRQGVLRDLDPLPHL
jgi:hypothetical protein